MRFALALYMVFQHPTIITTYSKHLAYVITCGLRSMYTGPIIFLYIDIDMLQKKAIAPSNEKKLNA